jgi:hypothetical protein
MLDNSKDAIDPKHQNNVYTIPFSCGKHYIGEVGRYFQVRLKKHCVNIKYNWVKRSSLVNHSQDIGHLICIENTKIISKTVKKGTRGP